ncbi:MAG: ABC transporter ATP-binding protein [Brachymonas sp.]|nr:ABC transporter ATP-binding protein [Brachymonas sp.]
MNASSRHTPQPLPQPGQADAPEEHSGTASGSASPAAASPTIGAVASASAPTPAAAPALAGKPPASSSLAPHRPILAHAVAAPATVAQAAVSTGADTGAGADADTDTDTGVGVGVGVDAAPSASAWADAPPSLAQTASPSTHTSPSSSAIVLEGISVRYQGTPVLHDVSARFACGQRWAIVGANGTGKSTLLKAAMRLLHCEAGQVRWQNLRRADIAYLPQQAGIDRNLPVRVQDLVALGLWHELRWWRGLRKEQWARVHAALDQVGMRAQAREPIAALSSGQFQRVLFARMLVQRARMLLLDEPFNAVDEATTADLLQVLHGCARQGAGIVAVVHDQEQARCHFDHILQLDKPAPTDASAAKDTSPAAQRTGTAAMGTASTHAAYGDTANTAATALATTASTNPRAAAAPPAQYSAASCMHPSSPLANTCGTGMAAQAPTGPGPRTACITGAFADQSRNGN